MEEIQFSFPYPAKWGEVANERTGSDVECPPPINGIDLCSAGFNQQVLTFSQKQDVVLEFVESGDWESEGYSGQLLRLCQAQPAAGPVLIGQKIGVCGKTEEGKITLTTLSQSRINPDMVYLPEQRIFYPLQPGKFDGLTVYKMLPVSEECKKDFTNILNSDEAKRCIQESMRLFADEAESTQEGKEFREFLKGLATAK